MASRLAKTAIGAATRTTLRPTLPGRALPAVSASLNSARFESNVPQKDPKQTANSIIDALPGSSTPAKIGFLSAGAGLSVAAISNELYVVNEETIVMISLLSVYWGIYHYLGPSYASWADSQAQKIKDILGGARKDHVEAVQSRIDSLQGVGEVVDVTKNLFAVSKETAQLEAQAFELEQKTALAAEAKSVLESWVRYESQLKQRQQRELAESIIAKIEKELQDPKILKQILDQSIKDVERIVSSKAA